MSWCCSFAYINNVQADLPQLSGKINQTQLIQKKLEGGKRTDSELFNKYSCVCSKTTEEIQKEKAVSHVIL